VEARSAIVAREATGREIEAVADCKAGGKSWQTRTGKPFDRYTKGAVDCLIPVLVVQKGLRPLVLRRAGEVNGP
jgi:hypothetical protein